MLELPDPFCPFAVMRCYSIIPLPTCKTEKLQKRILSGLSASLKLWLGSKPCCSRGLRCSGGCPNLSPHLPRSPGQPPLPLSLPSSCMGLDCAGVPMLEPGNKAGWTTSDIRMLFELYEGFRASRLSIARRDATVRETLTATSTTPSAAWAPRQHRCLHDKPLKPSKSRCAGINGALGWGSSF